MNKKRLLTYIFLFISAVEAAGQSVTVDATIDNIEMLVGEQVHVTIKATYPDGVKTVFPVYKPTQLLIPGVEVLDSKDLGEKYTDGGLNERAVVYTLTSFDDTLYYLPPFKIQVGDKEYTTKELALKVLTVEVDTLHPENFFGPKDVQDNPFQWSDWSLSFWLSVLVLVLFSLTYYLYLRLRDNKPIIAPIRIVRRLLPHQKAMKEIEQLKMANLTTAENPKEYYTKLTETLRKYIEERYAFSAMEMTSSEIIEKLTSNGDQQKLDELRQLFQTADLVKFAKYSTMINENDANLVNAIDFINQTKQDNMPQEETVKPQLSEADVRSQKARRVLKVFVITLFSIALLLIGYIAYEVYLLLI